MTLPKTLNGMFEYLAVCIFFLGIAGFFMQLRLGRIERQLGIREWGPSVLFDEFMQRTGGLFKLFKRKKEK